MKLDPDCETKFVAHSSSSRERTHDLMVPCLARSFQNDNWPSFAEPIQVDSFLYSNRQDDKNEGVNSYCVC